MKIDFVSDVACPWCAVGLNSLETALARIGDALDVELHFQPFELNPTMPPEGRGAVDYLVGKYGYRPEQIAQFQQAIRQRGADVGFRFGERRWIWNTFDAHRLLYWAGLEGRQRELKHALLAAYHGDGDNVSAADVLLRVAGEVGLDVGRARQIVESAAYAGEVRELERHYRDIGVDAVPTMIIDDRRRIEGGQPPDVIERTLRRLAGIEDAPASRSGPA